MTITKITSTNYLPKTNFKGTNDKTPNKNSQITTDNTKAKVDNIIRIADKQVELYKSLCRTYITGAALFGALLGALTHKMHSEDKAKDSMQELLEIFESEKITPNKIEIFDATGDKIPDIIIDKEDGTTAILDVKELNLEKH